MTERTFICNTEEDTRAFGARLAKELFPGAFVALYGELGAGKTALVQGVGEALGAEDILSPTFTIVEEHDTSPRLYHFDVYRLSGEDELYAMGYEDYLRSDGAILMEWANLVPLALPGARLDITIETDGDVRKLTCTPHGERYEGMVKRL